jgi:putative ABC transport system permease protein
MLGRVNVLNPENDKVFYESYYIVDASFFNLFDFPVLHGHIKTALSNPQSVVLTKETAIKIFGTPDVVGKTITTDRDSLPFKITSVITVPGNSHLQFNILFSEATFYRSQNFMDFFNNDWSSNSFVTYLLLKKQNPQQTALAINKLVQSNRDRNLEGKNSFDLQPLEKIHFYSAGLEGNTDKPGNIMHMWVFGMVALFVLLIASINYMNLSTAGFAARSKEIAVRKVAGATMQNLVKQFLAEASLLTMMALLISLAIVKLLLSRFNAFTEKQISFGFNTDYRIWLGVIGIAIFVGLISGIYPAFFQSRLKPFVLLKNKTNIGKGSLSIRRALVVFQFALSIIMIVATSVVYQQLKYVDTADMGFNKEQLVVVDINSGRVRRGAETIKTEFRKLSGVKKC